MNGRNRRKAERLRTVRELYPEIVDTDTGEDPLPSCSAVEALDRQEPFINAEELDRDLPSSIVDFVAAHLQLKSTLERAKAEMDAAGKAAQAEARAKKLPAKKDEPAKPVAAAKPIEAAKPEPPKTFSLFDAPAAQTRLLRIMWMRKRRFWPKPEKIRRSKKRTRNWTRPRKRPSPVS